MVDCISDDFLTGDEDMRSVFLKIVTSSLIIAMISIALYAMTQFLPEPFAVAYESYVFIIIIGISVFLAGSITEPLERLKNGFDSLLKGEPVFVEIDTGDELEEIGRYFNSVAKELKTREKILKDTKEKYRNLVENLHDWIFETDDKLNIIFSNTQGVNLLKEEKLTGRNLKELFVSLQTSNAVLDFETTLSDGRIIELSLNPIYKEGVISGFIGIARDITEKKRGEERMAHLAAITEHTIDAIVSLDVDSKIVSWNKGAERMFGYRAEEVVGKPLTSLIPKELHSKCRENFKKAVVEGYAKDIETVRIAKNGEIIIVDQTLTPIYDSKGEISGFVAIMRDITEKKKNEERLKRAYEELKKRTVELKYLANIVENSNDAIYSVNMEGKITSWNKTAEKLFGWKKNEILGRDVRELLPDGFEKEMEYILQKVKKGIVNLSYESKKKCKDGSIIDVEVTVSPIYDETGDLSGVSIIARDASHKVKTEEELIKRILKYKIEIGKVYLTSNFDLAMDVISDMAKMGFKSTVISRRLPTEKCTGCKVFWLSEKEGKDTIKPEMKAITDLILKLPPKGNVVVLELDYLLTRVDFTTLLKMIQQIKEDFYILRKGILILVADQNIFDKRQLSLLKIECEPLQKKEIRISPELHELLRFIYQKNRTGERPSIKDTMEALNLSRNTIKKRLRNLRDKGYVRVVKYGRTKLLEVTEEGKGIL